MHTTSAHSAAPGSAAPGPAAPGRVRAGVTAAPSVARHLSAHRARRTAVALGIASALGAAVYAQLHRDEFEAMARRVAVTADPQT